MPSVPDDDTLMRGVTGQAPAPPEPLTDPWGAAFRQANSVVSLATRMSQDVYPAEEGHSSLDNIKGTKYYDQYADRFAGSNSTREDYSIIARIEQEETDKRQLAGSGAAGSVALMVAGGADPLMFLPGGMSVRAGKAAVGIGEAMLEVGVASAVQSVAQESILRATQETRPFEESALNVGSATILGGLLGGAASRFMTPSEITTAAKGIDADRAWMNEHAGNPPLPSEIPATVEDRGNGSYFVRSTGDRGDLLSMVVKPDAVMLGIATVGKATRGQGVGTALYQKAIDFAAERGLPVRSDMSVSADAIRVYEGLRRRGYEVTEAPGTTTTAAGKTNATANYVFEVRKPDTANLNLNTPGLDAGAPGAPMAASAGAAAADVREMRPVPTALDSIPVVGRALEQSNPLTRVLASKSVAARRAVGDLVEVPTLLEQNIRGEPTVLGGGPAIERDAKNYINSTRVAVGDELDQQWKDLRFAGDKAPWFARTRAAFGNLDNPQKLPNFEEFKEQVFFAMQNNDQHAIPQVAAAAKFIRDNVFDPWLKRAQEIGLIGKDVDVKTAESYVQRVWNKQAIAAKRPEFVNQVMTWLKGEQAKNVETQQNLRFANGQLRSWEQEIGKFEDRIKTNEETSRALMARLDERAKEVERTGTRVEALEERAQQMAADIADTEQFIRDTRAQTKDPALLARLDSMEKDAQALRKADRPMTQAQLAALEDEELKSQLTGTNRMAAEMLVGRRKYPKAPSFVSWLVENGGFKDEGGELAGFNRPGLRNRRGRAFDQMGEKIQNEFPGSFPTTDDTGHGAPSRDEILNWISEASRGHEPAWWMDELSTADHNSLEAAKIAGALDEALNRAGVQVKTVKDVAAIFRDEAPGSVRLADLDQIAKDMEAAGQSVPVSIRRQGAEDELAVAREDVSKLRRLIASAQAGNAARAKRLGNTEIRAGEAQLAERANRGRLGILEDRLSRADMRRELLEDARQIAQKQHDDVRAKIEGELGKWAGTSAEEAKSAIKEREARAAATPLKPKGPRSTSADSDVDTAVQRILDKDTSLDDEALRDQAHEIVNHVEGTPGGRLPYDMQSGGPQEGYRPGANQAPRGPLAERAFNIPDAMVNDFLQHDIEHVTNAHLRTMVPDVLIAEHNGGDVNMTDTFRQIQDEYSALIDQSKDQAERTALAKERDNAIRDVAAMRDRVRGTYGMGATSVMPNAARWAAAVKNYNVLASMGMATLSSLPDMAGPVMRYGLGTVFNDAWSPFLKSLMSGGELNREAIRQFRAMGIVVESEIAARHHSLSDTLDSFHPKSRLERTLQVGADRFQFINGLGPWTDFGKLVTSTVASQEIFRAAKAMSEGTATARQLRQLGEANITRDLADRIAQQYAESGQVVDGVHLPNTGDWTDKEARRAFEGAIGREADIAIVTPGQEKPLWMSNPLLSVLGQFKSFTAAATQRILVANLQRADAQVLQGVMLSLGLGMMSYKLNSALGGQPTSDNPGDWVKEAMSRGNMFGWLEEGNAMTSKITRGQLDMYRALGSKHELSRYAGRSVMDQLLGPTAGKIEKFQQIAGAAASRDWKESDTHALHQVTAYGNLFWLRNILNEVEHGANNAFGIPMKQQ